MSTRIRKINELIRELVAASISENISKDYIATVTGVEASRDLKHAVVWVSVINREDDFWKELEGVKNIIRHDVTSKMYTKYTPLIDFRADHSGEYAQKIEMLLNEKEPK